VSDTAVKLKRMRMVIRAYDLDRSLEFYRDKLGLQVLYSWDRPDGAGYLLDACGGVIELIGKKPGDAARGGWDFIMPVAKYDIVLEVENAQAAHDALKARGLSPAAAPETTSWGGIWFSLLDPDETPVVFLEVRPSH
jgi:catechol 2,3-dioxygenase-like lactoylglutathione lyase family enzyme